jgi:trehalose-6-phosphate synthase
LVGFVNGRYGSVCHQPVVYVHRTLPPAELASLYAAADVALVGSIREGVNLAAMEFVAAQSFSGHDEKGVLLYSEFAGCASSFQVQRRARARERRAVCTLEYTFLFACCSYSPTLVL